MPSLPPLAGGGIWWVVWGRPGETPTCLQTAHQKYELFIWKPICSKFVSLTYKQKWMFPKITANPHLIIKAKKRCEHFLWKSSEQDFNLSQKIHTWEVGTRTTKMPAGATFPYRAEQSKVLILNKMIWQNFKQNRGYISHLECPEHRELQISVLGILEYRHRVYILIITNSEI